MARMARKVSQSGIYHIMLRGINRQPIFTDEGDCAKFIEILCMCQKISQFRLFAYCLMGNHVHLLLQAGEEPIELAMKRIGTRFAVWFNKKHSRVGHLFQDRFRSKPVENDRYFLIVLRYILYNPVKAGLCMKPEDYRMSSARDYFAGGGIADTSYAEEIAGKTGLREFLRTDNDDECMDDVPVRLNDEMAYNLISTLTKGADQKTSARIILEHPELYLPALRSAGMSIRQICRLTGLSFGKVRKY